MYFVEQCFSLVVSPSSTILDQCFSYCVHMKIL
uniref:Uncharacterized protein n=1 Tax=Anguilla anguilla TaxID=7936 RepID=A0A0E9PKP3_ANGAN